MLRGIKDSIKATKDSKVICTLFTVFDYFTFVKENGFKTEYKGISLTDGEEPISKFTEEKEILEDLGDPIIKMKSKKSDASLQHEEALSTFQGTKEGADIIDSIVSMSIYWMLTFDWSGLGVFVKEFAKEDYTKHRGNLMGFIIRHLGRSFISAKASIYCYLFILL